MCKHTCLLHTVCHKFDFLNMCFSFIDIPIGSKQMEEEDQVFTPPNNSKHGTWKWWFPSSESPFSRDWVSGSMFKLPGCSMSLPACLDFIQNHFAVFRNRKDIKRWTKPFMKGVVTWGYPVTLLLLKRILLESQRTPGPKVPNNHESWYMGSGAVYFSMKPTWFAYVKAKGHRNRRFQWFAMRRKPLKRFGWFIPKNPFVCPKISGLLPLHSYSKDGIGTLNSILGRGLDS